MNGKVRRFVFLSAMLAFLAGCGGVPTGDASIEGTVVDATTNAPIANASVCLGDTIKCATTDADGSFYLEDLPSGMQDFTVSANGYSDLEQSVELEDYANVTFAMNPALADGQYRIVLSWGSDPDDLDSHLYTPAGEDIYYSNEGNCSADPWACLDVDDRDGYGPETITIVQPDDGTYKYAVKWFGGDGTWAGSGAVVSIYDSDGLVEQFNVPYDTSHSVNSWWYVFDMKVSVDDYGNSVYIEEIGDITDVDPF